MGRGLGVSTGATNVATMCLYETTLRVDEDSGRVMMIKLLCFAFFFVAAVTMAADKNIYSFTLNSIDGQPSPLSAYKGKVVLLVNVASRCGFTPQYTALEAIYGKYKDRGFVIVGIPANNFGS